MSSKQAVLLDRDGTINIDHGYVFTSDRLELCDGAAAAIGDLKRAGYLVAIVSNQSAIGRGWATAEQVDETNRLLQDLLLQADADARIDYVAYCPDAPEVPSTRRKPATGMFEEISAALGIGADDCWMIGDKPSDVEFGTRSGLRPDRCLLIGDGASALDLRSAVTTMLARS